MASIPTPQTIPSAHDWAKDTTASISYIEGQVKRRDVQLEPEKKGIPEPQHRTSDSSRNFPGYFPVSMESDTGDKSSLGVLDTAQQAFQSATDAAKQYLPESMAGYLPRSQDTEPSQTASPETAHTTEVSSTKEVPPHISTPRPGHGSKPCLSTHHHHEGEPGTKEHKDTLPSTEVPTGAPGGVGSLPGDKSEESVAKLPEERHQEDLPSHETGEEFLGKTGGVGPLPGPPTESGVALAPEERVHPEEDILTSRGTRGCPAVATTAAGVATATMARNTAAREAKETDTDKTASIGQEEAQVHKFRTIPGTKQDLSDPNLPVFTEKSPPCEARTYPCPGKPGTIPGTRAEVAENTHERNSAPPVPPPKETAPAVPTAGTGKAGGDRRASTGSAAHKVGFLDRVKGEAKVISGKLGRNEKKVEEGRHLMGKE